MGVYEVLLNEANLPKSEQIELAKKQGFPSYEAYLSSLHELLETWRPKTTVAEAQARLDQARKDPEGTFNYYNRVYTGVCKSIPDMFSRLESSLADARKREALARTQAG